MTANLIRAATVVAALLFGTTAFAYSSYYSPNCAGCHGTTSTCAGCHVHGTHNTGGAINLTASIPKTSYAAGEAIAVTINGGYRSGWVGVAVLDANGAVVGSASAQSLPATITVNAPAAAGTYSWKGAWYGNRYDSAGGTFGDFTADPNNANHGWESVALPAFTVAGTTPPPEPKIALSPASLAFGTVDIGKSMAQVAQVQNSGQADLVVSSIAPCAGTSAEYGFSPATGFTVASGASQALTVTYAPADTTTDTGCIAISSNDSAQPVAQLAVSGSGQAAAAPVVDVDITRFAVAKRLDISRGGTTAPKVSVVNAGTIAGEATVAVEGTTVDAAGATLVVYTATQTVTLAPAATARASFPVYTPTGPGTITWTASVADGSPDQDAASAVMKIVP